MTTFVIIEINHQNEENNEKSYAGYIPEFKPPCEVKYITSSLSDAIVKLHETVSQNVVKSKNYHRLIINDRFVSIIDKTLEKGFIYNSKTNQIIKSLVICEYPQNPKN